LNNNRNNQNNRRRGRGNNRPQGGGGGGRGEQLNRIDSRARGNAPQLLEKFKKLASDAHLNGDRVTAEYYLQFADHYFRVIADARLRMEEQRARREDRPGEGGSYAGQASEDGDEGEFGGNDDFGGFDQQQNYQREYRNEPQRDYRPEPRAEQGGDARPPRRERSDEDQRGNEAQPEQAAESFEPASNPFTRDNSENRAPENRGSRGLRPRRERAPRDDRGDDGGDEPSGLDPSLLPPAISEARDAAPPADDDAPPPPRRRGRPRRAATDEGGEPLEAVNG
jgi:hypothetical protein